MECVFCGHLQEAGAFCTNCGMRMYREDELDQALTEMVGELSRDFTWQSQLVDNSRLIRRKSKKKPRHTLKRVTGQRFYRIRAASSWEPEIGQPRNE